MKLKLVLVVFCFASFFANSQTKVGTINSEFIVGLMPEAKEVLKELNLYASKLDSSYQDKLADYNFNYFIFGHTHIPMKKIKKKKKILINPGSVGQPRIDSFKAHWLLFDSSSKKFTLKKTNYSLKKIKKQIFKHDSNNMRLLKYFK